MNTSTNNSFNLNNCSPKNTTDNLNNCSPKDTTDNLNNCSPKDIPPFSLENLETFCRLVDIYDGDTITCIIPIFNNLYRFQIRLNGIDTPEIKTKIQNIKQDAICSKRRVIELTTSGKCQVYLKEELQKYLEDNSTILWIKCRQFDKYGRILCDVYSNKDDKYSISEILIQENLAVPYDGKTKTLIH